MAKSIPNYDTSIEDPFAGLPGYSPATPAKPSHRTNQYPGNCGLCKARIQPNEGRIELVAGRWVTYHVGDCPTPTVAAPAAVTEDGMYRTPDGVIYKVQVAHHGSGNLYAKRLTFIDGWEFETHGKRKATLEFERGAIRKLDASMKMTLDQAKEFGHLYGMCCKCGAILTDENSIAAGIGPVCRAKGWA